MGYAIHECGGYMEEDADDFYYHEHAWKIEDLEDVVCKAVDEDLAEAGLVELDFDE